GESSLMFTGLGGRRCLAMSSYLDLTLTRRVNPVNKLSRRVIRRMVLESDRVPVDGEVGHGRRHTGAALLESGGTNTRLAGAPVQAWWKLADHHLAWGRRNCSGNRHRP